MYTAAPVPRVHISENTDGEIGIGGRGRDIIRCHLGEIYEKGEKRKKKDKRGKLKLKTKIREIQC
jgi:hypothetical protein